MRGACTGCLLCVSPLLRLPETTLEREGGLGPKTKVTADTARVICDGDGVHVLMPRVESRPDGRGASRDLQLPRRERGFFGRSRRRRYGLERVDWRE